MRVTQVMVHYLHHYLGYHYLHVPNLGAHWTHSPEIWWVVSPINCAFDTAMGTVYLHVLR